MSDKMTVEWTFEVDLDIYNGACMFCKACGTTIEEMTTAFIHFCVKPENLPLVEVFLTEAPGTEARELINQRITQGVLEIALHQRS